MSDQPVTLADIARELGARGILTATGGQGWTATGVQNLLARGAGQ